MNGVDTHPAHADPHSTLPFHVNSTHQNAPSTNGVLQSHLAGEEEEPYTIKCVCGYHDDDGNTVLCEKCNSWQHIECYYPAKNVPEIHKCVDCAPRHLDARRAAERQKRLREARTGGDKKAKRPAPKNPKKKSTKDVAQMNGFHNGLSGHGEGNTVAATDRRIGSPRDQPPPAKRPKTNHKVTGSTISLNESTNDIPRSAPGFSTPHATSPVKVSEAPATNGDGYFGPLFSPEFIGLYPSCLSYQSIESNSFHDIGVTSSLSTWLKDSGALADVANGKTRAEVFQQYDRPIEDLQAPGIERHVIKDDSIAMYGGHPTWQWLSIDRPVIEGAFVGELIGQIGRREDYVKEPANRWSFLRHPEPFVFFPPHLPIYIDTRVEGNVLRGIRRSCRPNVKMNILITDGMMYHFCFIAMKNIAQDEEITIGWDLDEDVQRLLYASLSSGNIKKEGFLLEEEQYISSWVTGVLSNFGGCPCDRLLGGCVMDRFVRSNALQFEPASQPSNTITKKRAKKPARQGSPLNSGLATNNLAASEAWNDNGPEDEPATDGQSVSASSQSKAGSRDLTPVAHLSVEGPLSVSGLEMSDRERRKLMQQEKLFEQLEHEQQSVKGRKKRTSGSSAVNTPAATSTKFFKSPTPGSASNYFRPRAFSDAPKDRRAPLQGCQPTYTEFFTQTDISGMQSSVHTKSTPLRRYSSLSQRILRKCYQARSRAEIYSSDLESPSYPSKPKIPSRIHTPNPQQAVSSSPSSPLRHSISNGNSELRIPKPMTTSLHISPVLANGQAMDHDADMHDIPDMNPASASEYNETNSSTGPLSQNPTRSTHPPIQPPPPPWLEQDTLDEYRKPKDRQRKAIGLHVQLPLSVQSQPTTPSTPSSENASSATGFAILQSPATLTPKPPLYSPALSNVVSHSSAKKRISFSDYLSRKGSSIHAHQTASTSVGFATSSPVTPGSGAGPTSQLDPGFAPPTSDGDGMDPSVPKLHSLDINKNEGVSSAEVLKAG